MDEWTGMQAKGRLSLPKGEGEGEGFCRRDTEIEPLTFILSPCPRERRNTKTP
jgi:hypothetical protein